MTFTDRIPLLIVGFIVCLGSLVSVFQVLDKVYLDPRFNVNVAFGVFVIAFVAFIFGGWIILDVLGLIA
jgi:hypothetical protein